MMTTSEENESILTTTVQDLMGFLKSSILKHKMPTVYFSMAHTVVLLMNIELLALFTYYLRKNN